MVEIRSTLVNVLAHSSVTAVTRRASTRKRADCVGANRGVFLGYFWFGGARMEAGLAFINLVANLAVA